MFHQQPSTKLVLEHIICSVLKQPLDGELSSALSQNGYLSVPCMIGMSREDMDDLDTKQQVGEQIQKVPLSHGLSGVLYAFKQHIHHLHEKNAVVDFLAMGEKDAEAIDNLMTAEEKQSLKNLPLFKPVVPPAMLASEEITFPSSDSPSKHEEGSIPSVVPPSPMIVPMESVPSASAPSPAVTNKFDNVPSASVSKTAETASAMPTTLLSVPLETESDEVAKEEFPVKYSVGISSDIGRYLGHPDRPPDHNISKSLVSTDSIVSDGEFAFKDPPPVSSDLSDTVSLTVEFHACGSVLPADNLSKKYTESEQPVLIEDSTGFPHDPGEKHQYAQH